jgi:hypothetical protein
MNEANDECSSSGDRRSLLVSDSQHQHQDQSVAASMKRKHGHQDIHDKVQEREEQQVKHQHPNPKAKEHSEIEMKKGFCDSTNLHHHESNHHLDDSINTNKVHQPRKNRILNPYLKNKTVVDINNCQYAHKPDEGTKYRYSNTANNRLDDTNKNKEENDNRNGNGNADINIRKDAKWNQSQFKIKTAPEKDFGPTRHNVPAPIQQSHEQVKNPYTKDPNSSSIDLLDSVTSKVVNPYLKRQTNNHISAGAPRPCPVVKNWQAQSSDQPHPVAKPVAVSILNITRPHHCSIGHSSTAPSSVPAGIHTNASAMPVNPYIPRPPSTASSPVHCNPYNTAAQSMLTESLNGKLNAPKPLTPINPYTEKVISKPSTLINPYAIKSVPIDGETVIQSNHNRYLPPLPRPLSSDDTGGASNNQVHNMVVIPSPSESNPYKGMNQSSNPYKAIAIESGQPLGATGASQGNPSSALMNEEVEQDEVVLVGVIHGKEVQLKQVANPSLASSTSVHMNQSAECPRINASISSISSSNTIQLPQELRYDENRLKVINDENRLKLIKAANLGGTLKNGWKLLPHQKVGVLKAVQMRRLVLAYDMGLGKTLIGCVYAKAFKETFPNLKVHVIAPVSLKKEWARTASDIVGLKCEEEKKGAKGKVDQESLDIRISSWAKVPLRVPNHVESFVVICDEAHNLQSMDSARTKDTLKLVLSKK